jgi:nitrite reductase/ring-hydroxylating ferredoxin subunit
MNMKKIKFILLFAFSLMLLNLTVSAQESVRIGCFSNSTGVLSYSTCQMDVIVNLATGLSASRTILIHDAITNQWYLKSHITGGVIGVPVTVSGSIITMSNGCVHKSTCTATCQCDIKNVVQCVSHDCICSVGDGGCSSSIAFDGVIINQGLKDYVNANPPSNCQ